MDKDQYGETINGKNTYKEIADRLIKGQSVIVGWTDEKNTHLDILFTYRVYKEKGNYLQRGLRGNELFVSIMSIGAFGFDIDNSKKAPGYIGEKLGLNNCPTIEKLAELINEVIKEINNEII